jgi:hypothetical protein
MCFDVLLLVRLEGGMAEGWVELGGANVDGGWMMEVEVDVDMDIM